MNAPVKVATDDHGTHPPAEPGIGCPVRGDADPRTILRDGTMRQAGFRADLITRFGDCIPAMRVATLVTLPHRNRAAACSSQLEA